MRPHRQNNLSMSPKWNLILPPSIVLSVKMLCAREDLVVRLENLLPVTCHQLAELCQAFKEVKLRVKTNLLSFCPIANLCRMKRKKSTNS
jgi:hypothetical protein